MVSNTSSTCMEALAKGIPVIITSNNNFVDQNPIPINFPKEVWALCNDANEFKNAIKYLLLGSSSRRNNFLNNFGKKVLKDYFEPVTSENIQTLLNLN